MSLGKTATFAALLAVVATTGCLWLAKHRRTQEIVQLRETNRKMWLKARPEAPAPRSPASLPTTVPAAVLQAAPAPAAAVDSDYRNFGNATPQATLQTFAWACDKLDTELLAKLVYFDPAARTKAEAFLATLPEKMRAEWRSPEALAAIGLADAMQLSRFPRAVVLEKAELEQLNENRVVLHLNGAAKERTEYQRTESGWKYVITEKAVDAFLARAISGK
jgi:hypothetical protein